MKSKRSVAYEDGLLEDLKDMNFVVGYLNSILDGLSADESLEPFLLALGRVAKAHGMQKIAVTSKRTRDAIYKALSKQGNPTFSTLHGILDTMGLQLHVQQKKKRA
jgi:probable addiction module antidote protein